MTTNQHIIDAAKSLLDTVEPDKYEYIDGQGRITIVSTPPTNYDPQDLADHEVTIRRLVYVETVESLLTECQKQARKEVWLEASGIVQGWGDARRPVYGGNALRNCADELRRMAEGEK